MKKGVSRTPKKQSRVVSKSKNRKKKENSKEQENLQIQEPAHCEEKEMDEKAHTKTVVMKEYMENETQQNGVMCSECRNYTDVKLELVTQLQEENRMLREEIQHLLSTMNMLGITSHASGDTQVWGFHREGSKGNIGLEFEIKDSGNNYTVQITSAHNCDVPEYMYKGIEFKKKSFILFFYKLMQIIRENKINK